MFEIRDGKDFELFLRKHYDDDAVLLNDVDVSDMSANGWCGYCNGPYKMCFDGCGHVISGVAIGEESIIVDEQPVGQDPFYDISLDDVDGYDPYDCGGKPILFALFPIIDKSGCVKNLTVKGIIKPGVVSGGVAAVNFGRIENCSSYVTINALGEAGGICGENHGTIIDCRNCADVNSDMAGGICGSNRKPNGAVVCCVNEGTITTGKVNFQTLVNLEFKENQMQIFGHTERQIPYEQRSKGKGKLLFLYGNSLVGQYISQGDYKITELEQLLLRDPDTTHLNDAEQTYLHIAAERATYSPSWFRPEQMAALVVSLSLKTDIDFEAKDKFGKTALDYLTSEKYNINRYRIAIDAIKAHIKAEQEAMAAAASSFSDIGF